MSMGSDVSMEVADNDDAQLLVGGEYKRYFAATKPIARHLVFSAQPARPVPLQLDAIILKSRGMLTCRNTIEDHVDDGDTEMKMKAMKPKMAVAAAVEGGGELPLFTKYKKQKSTAYGAVSMGTLFIVQSSSWYCTSFRLSIPPICRAIPVWREIPPIRHPVMPPTLLPNATLVSRVQQSRIGDDRIHQSIADILSADRTVPSFPRTISRPPRTILNPLRTIALCPSHDTQRQE
ncbi:hypothetical protein FISHEDRAFT_58683 [Fistulina hepatica ATCC 64428]|uniref:Uncharacterized protein n=1 Tax=Fistulina hepatica ATCC 64428 TaxID=1128425 RepID=A0A0D7AEJ9_9AGAR|nr:hypothetical protein FISHEDRAFT_58683 [Fistulina hepatica ATCC 64428]